MERSPDARSLRSPRTSVILIAGATAWNVAQNRLLPRWSYVPGNVCGIGLIAYAARHAGISREQLGIDSRRPGRGALTGAMVAGVAAGVVWIGVRLRPGLFADTRVIGTRPAYEVLLRIPVGTASFEEVLFRGLLQAAWGSAGSSTAFGAWHVLPTLQTAAVNGLPRAPSAAAAVVVTVAAGRALASLRARYGLVAAVVAHAGINIAGYLAARAASSNR
ncbi:MAG TPA: CPBP family intramembrane glutamic endopeptidase [Acidimicrobiia bacterium]